MDTDQARRAVRIFDQLFSETGGDDFNAMKQIINDARTDGLSTSSRQAQIALDARQDALDGGADRVAAMDAAITAGLAANRS